MTTGIAWSTAAVLLPFAGGALAMLCARKKSGMLNGISLGTTLLTLAAVTAMIILPDGVYTLWDLGLGLKVILLVDSFSRIFAGLTAVMFTLVGVFSLGYFRDASNKASFVPFFLWTEAALLALAFAGNLITLYIAFEMMTLLALPLVLHARSKEALNAAVKYLFYSLFGALMALAGIFILSPALQGSHFGAYVLAENGKEALLQAGVFAVVLGFGAKAGMFPLHGWLPSAHPVAPAPASALLSGVITKAGVFAVLRVVFCAVGSEFVAGTWVQYCWLALALFTTVLGSVMAYREPGLKKRLAYSTVSQVAYLFLGMGLLNGAGFNGTLLHLLFHSAIKDGLFLCAGSIIVLTGCTRVDELRSMGKRLPVTMGCFAVLSLALVGIPPFSGFVSKWQLLTGSLQAGGLWAVLGPVALLVSALFTAGYLLTVSVSAFLQPPAGELESVRVKEPLTLVIPMVILAAAALLAGVFGAPFAEMTGKIALLVMGG